MLGKGEGAKKIGAGADCQGNFRGLKVTGAKEARKGQQSVHVTTINYCLSGCPRENRENVEFIFLLGLGTVPN